MGNQILGRTLKLLISMVVVLTLPGCWDPVELTDRAIVVSASADLVDTRYLLSYQIALPGGLSPQQVKGAKEGQTFFVVDGTGDTIRDALQDIQTRLPRRAFLGMRKNIFIGEPLAKAGLTQSIDVYMRNPQLRLGTDMFVVKGTQGVDILHLTSPLEPLPSLAAGKTLQNSGTKSGTSSVNFLIASSDGTSAPILPCISVSDLNRNGTIQSFKIYGSAIFDQQLRLAGYLDFDEETYRRWIVGSLSRHTFRFKLPEYSGFISFDSSNFKSRLTPSFSNGQFTMKLDLYTDGKVLENNTPLDISITKNVKKLQAVAEENFRKQTVGLIDKLQRYQTDCIGYNQSIYRTFPPQWTKVKGQWPEEFRNIHTEVQVHVVIQSYGNTTRPLQNGDW